MKKFMAILCAAALALTVSVAYADTNLALSGTAIGSNPDGENVAANAIDNNAETYYGSLANDTTMANGEYVGVILDGTYNINKLVLNWGGGCPAEDGYDVEITTDGENWTKVSATVSRTEIDATHKTDTVTLSATAKGVRAVVNKAMGKNTLQCWEFEIYGTAAQGGNENVGGNENENVGGNEGTGVASTLAFAVVAMSAAAVAFTSKKKA